MLPEALKKGDYIGVIAPSDSIEQKDEEYILKSCELVQSYGLKVIFGDYIRDNETGYGAKAENKAKDLNKMFLDSKIKAIFAVKGGNNSNSIFEYINYNNIKNNPKIICGFSDTTSITNIIYSRTGLITFSGPTFKSFTSWKTDYAFKEMINRLMNNNLEIDKKEEIKTIVSGNSQGILIGGNLNLFSELISGEYKVDVKDKILFLEDLGAQSSPQAISNYFYMMKQNKVFEKINGIWLGNYEHESKITIEQILLDTIGNEYNFPIIKSNHFGHIDKKITVPIGIKVEINTNSNDKIRFLQNCVI